SEDSPPEGGASDGNLAQEASISEVSLEDSPRASDRWAPLVEELLAREGMLSEVLLDVERYEEIPLIQSIIDAAPGRASLAGLGRRSVDGGVVDEPGLLRAVGGRAEWESSTLRIVLVLPSLLSCVLPEDDEASFAE